MKFLRLVLILTYFALSLTACGGGSGSSETAGQTDADAVAAAKLALSILYAEGDSAISVTQNVGLDTTASNGVTVTWASDLPDIIAVNGTVARPAFSSNDTLVTLTATINKNESSDTSIFELTVLKSPGADAEVVAADKAALDISYGGGDTFDNVTQNITLVTVGPNGSTITWVSDTPGTVAIDGAVNRPAFGSGDAAVTVTAIISTNGVEDTKVFNLTVTETPPLDAEAIAVDKTALDIAYAVGDSAGSVSQNVGLATAGASGTSISWESDLPAIIATDGTVMRPVFGSGDTVVTLTATLSKNVDNDTKIFVLTVLEVPPTDVEVVAADKAALDIIYSGSDSISSVTLDVSLPTTGSNGSTISWDSDTPGTVTIGGIVTRPAVGDAMVTLTATIEKNASNDTKLFILTVLEAATDNDIDGFDSDIDCNDSDGAINPGAADVPDDSLIDSNCDGMDGDESKSFFVSTSGSDANAGTKSAPFKTIQFAIDAAVADINKKNILIGSGTHIESPVLADGVNLFGGYDVSFVRSINQSSVISSPTTTGLLILDHTSNGTVDAVAIDSANGVAAGSSTYGIKIVGSTNVSIRNTSITSGSAGNGSIGANGTNGENGGDASVGTDGACDDAAVDAQGGTGGLSPAGRIGGNGGAGGNSCGNGGVGEIGAVATAGGTSGAYGESNLFACDGPAGGIGGPGDPGIDGSNGSAGAGGAGGYISANDWISNNGDDGTDGTDGHGGGGGGGGGGQCGTCVTPGTGNGGGGGGGGGSGGTLGTGGRGGGGSFGIFIVDSTGTVLENNTISSNTGGDGGAGGTGGAASFGGAGFAGATMCTGEVGAGGNGGNGGDGGSGGHGGGGAGGPSIAVYSNGIVPSVMGNTLNVGAAGSGGSSAGNPGSTGTAAGTN